MDKKLYKKPLVEEVDFDSDVNVMMASKTKPIKGGKSEDITEEDIYSDPFATPTE